MAQELTVEEIYNFDTAGWLHLPSVLSAPELVAAASSLSEEPEQLAEQLLEHPALKLRVEQLVASPNRADADRVVREDGSFTLQMNGPAAELDVTQEELLTGGPVGEDGVLDTSRTYFNQAGHRYVHGLVVIWALAPGESDGGYEVVTASHKSTMPVPAHMRTVVGGGALRDLGLLQQPPLQAGDVLLVSSATLQGARHPSGGTGPRLLRAEFLSRRARPTVTREPHAPEREADWMAELDPIQRVVMGLEPQKRTAGDGLPTLRARDGTAWLEEDAEGTRPLHHPTALVPNLELSERQREEFFLWEMGGYLVVRGLMDADWIAAANAAVNWAMEQPEDSPHHIPHGRSGNFLRPLSLPHPHCDPFRRMVAHPAVLERMEWMLGSGFVHYGSAPVRLVNKGDGGQRIHAGLMDREMDYHYIHFSGGRSYAESLNVSWQLSDHCLLGGGLHVVPGSHKANYRMPDTMSFHPTTREEGPLPQCTWHPDTKAGDVVIFSGMGTGHGVGRWQSEHQRRIVIMGYLSRSITNGSSGHFGQSGFLKPAL